MVATGVAWVATRRGYELREPDLEERAAVAEPIARILDRHVGTAWLNDDLLDGVSAAAGVTSYAQTKPLQPAGGAPTHDPDALPDGYEEP